MAKAQFPIDGRLGKDWKVTSYMGWRIHPVQKIKKHHNGTDIWSKHEPCWIEAPYDGKVLEARKSTAAGGGFGNFVILLHKINGQWYTSLYAHMGDGTLKVKKGQRITAGTPLGRMASTGMSTGKHLHWELRKGNKHIWDAKGKNYIEPVAFFKALIAQEKAIASAPVTAKDDDPVAPAPVHSEEHADAVEAQRQAAKAVVTPAPVATPTAPAKLSNPGYPGHYLAKGSGEKKEVAYLRQQLGLPAGTEFDDALDHAVKQIQKKHNLTADGIVGPKTWALID